MSEVFIVAGLIATWGGSVWIGRIAALRNENVMALLSAFVPAIAVLYALTDLITCWKPLLIIAIGVVILIVILF